LLIFYRAIFGGSAVLSAILLLCMFGTVAVATWQGRPVSDDSIEKTGCMLGTHVFFVLVYLVLSVCDRPLPEPDSERD
jgi:hypothetical protein